MVPCPQSHHAPDPNLAQFLNWDARRTQFVSMRLLPQVVMMRSNTGCEATMASSASHWPIHASAIVEPLPHPNKDPNKPPQPHHKCFVHCLFVTLYKV